MNKLRKHIKESFFNPVFHLLALVFFMVVDEFYGLNVAWKIAFPVALLSVFYVYFIYNQIFTWHLFFTFIFMSVGLLSSLAYFIPAPSYIQEIETKIIIVILMLLLLVFRNQIQKIILSRMSNLIPMSNNFNELYRVVWAILITLSFYNIVYLVLHFFVGENIIYYFQLLQALFVGTIFFLVTYEIIRVQLIRTNLIKEEWWPVVSDQGKIIGSIQHLTSLNDENKYLHPIIRVILIDKGMIFLQKRLEEDKIFPGMWDTAFSNHVRVGENIEQCIETTAKERYALEGFKYMYLSNYIAETENEKHYAFLFVSCQQVTLTTNPAFIENTKWWTQQQILKNLGTGIFSKNFEIEYDLLSRSGLLETGKCNCNCRLKEIIYQQSNILEKPNK